MISLKVNDVKNFMNHLLVLETFDSFLICEGDIHTATFFHIQGKINRAFFDADTLSSMEDDFLFWRDVRHVVFEMIRGKKTPTNLKITLALPKSNYAKLVTNSGMDITIAQISGVYLHIHYTDDAIRIITGTSTSVFTMDKTLDHYWDQMMTHFLSQHFDCEEL